MNRTDYENKNLNELILQIRDEQPGIMNREELKDFISREKELKRPILADIAEKCLEENKEIEYFIFDDNIYQTNSPVAIKEKMNILGFMDVDLDTCISEHGHKWVEEDACAESGTSTMRCTICGFSHTISF